MAITKISLVTPDPTEVYNVEVFNDNAKKIQNVINGDTSEGLIPNVEYLLTEIQKKYPYFTEQTDINNVLEDGVYYNIKSNNNILTGNILFSIKINENETIQTLISVENNNGEYIGGIIKQRKVTKTAVGDWITLTIKVVNDLNTGGSQDALSAEQGKLLNEVKLNRYTKTEKLNIDEIEEGIYVCSAGIETKNINDNPVPEDLQLIFIQYGDGVSTPSIQIIHDSKSGNSFYVRYFNLTDQVWSWSVWYSVGGSGGAESPISLDTADDYPH